MKPTATKKYVPLTHDQRRELIERALPAVHVSGHSHGGSAMGWDGSRGHYVKRMALMQWDDWSGFKDQGYQP
jgi:hypothetical protein